MKLGKDDVLWSSVCPRAKWSKIPPQLLNDLRNWIIAHPDVLQSPLRKDILMWVKDDGSKEPIAKLLITISIVELHNDMIRPESEGGLKGVRGVEGNVLISDTALRDNLPWNLRPIHERHKQVCGCKTCTMMGEYVRVLRQFRLKAIRDLTSKDKERGGRYEAAVFPKGVTINQRSSKIREEILCPVVDGCPHQHWNCVLGRCTACPKYVIPEEEKALANEAPKIRFPNYKKTIRCTVHGLLDPGKKSCEECSAVSNVKGAKTGKITIRKELADKTVPIGTFHEKYYIPMLKKYRYHYGLVNMLSKKHCYDGRTAAFKAGSLDIMTRRDYAERLTAKFNQEIQSTHFGQSVTLSMEGCFVEFVVGNDDVQAHFHSHMADKSNQDAASTHAHMRVLLELLISQEKIIPGKSTIWEHTDGCTKQYRCAKALYLLSSLASEFKVVIDRQVDAPGHGKDVVDGLNAQDKVYLRKHMISSCAATEPRTGPNAKLKMDAAVVDGDNKAISFAKQCVELCSQKMRQMGVVSHKKLKKREDKKKMKQRFYHYQDFDEVEYKDSKFRLKGFEEGDHNGIMAHYNFRFDPDLTLGFCAARRIPCSCKSCLDQLKLPWDKTKDETNQDRYKQNRTCTRWNMFQGLNDWKIIQTSATTTYERDTETIKRSILRRHQSHMSSLIKIGDTAAYNVDDENADGFYIVQWDTEPYVDDATGQLMCDAHFYDNPPRCQSVYCLVNLPVKVRVQHVMATNIVMEKITDTKQLPKNAQNKKQLISDGVFTISATDLEDIHNEI